MVSITTSVEEGVATSDESQAVIHNYRKSGHFSLRNRISRASSQRYKSQHSPAMCKAGANGEAVNPNFWKERVTDQGSEV